MSLCENDNLSNNLSNNELYNIVNLLQKKVSELEKKINKLETENQNNTNNWNYNQEVILEEKIFRSICIEPPEISRQNGFNLSVNF
tara:strand:- start:97 stop:354 length:258 start_codon:yes stop_codon:yes gene_type:complete